jgi:hypothetical protein
LCDLAAGHRHRRGHRHDAAGDPAAGLDGEKKTLSASERDAAARAACRQAAAPLDPRDLVSVDECGTHRSLARTRARRAAGGRPTARRATAAG